MNDSILKKNELIGKPKKVIFNKVEEIKLFDLAFSSLQSKHNILKDKLLKSNTLEVDNIIKLRFLLQNIETLINNADEVIECFDKEGIWKLNNEDINRINCNNQTNDILKTFLPYMLSYHLLKH